MPVRRTPNEIKIINLKNLISRLKDENKTVDIELKTLRDSYVKQDSKAY